MAREIKFRGKSVRSGKWLYGYLAEARGKVLQTRYTEKVIFENLEWFNTDNFGFVLNDYAVDPETIGQYTGLKDCDGKEIYEGDFIQSKKYPESEPLLVEYNYGGFGYMYFGEFYLFGGNPNFTFKPFNTDDDFEIIGNIHDNPELLKTKQI